MMTSKLPSISIIVLNYFGEKLITQVVEALENLNYPKDKYEILIVDNASEDNSIEILHNLATKYDNVKLILLNKNLGFSKGNNIGINQANGEYVVLLNNDCLIDRNWLKELVKTAQSHPKVFAVNSKILLYHKYINLNLEIDPYLVLQYSWLSKSNIRNFSNKKIYLNLVKKDSRFQTEIPFDPENDSDTEITLVFNCGNEIDKKNLRSLIKFSTTGFSILECTAAKNEVKYIIKFDLKIKSLTTHNFSKIQNAGIMPFQDGYARDIGGTIKDGHHHYERDNDQYNKETEVYAACGAALLMSKKVLEKIGYLDESFFMYYEDVEIAERARLRGYKIFYSPKAIVRHMHARSSKVGSDFFIFHVERGRLLHLLYSFPLQVFFNEYFKLILIVGYGLVKAILHLRHLRSYSKKTQHEKPSYHIKLQKLYVLSSLSIRLPWLLYLRYRKNSDLKKNAIVNNYNEILSGRWYFE